MSEKTQEERLARLKSIIELLYGPKGAAEASRRLGFSNSGLAATRRGERGVTRNLETRIARLAIDDSVRIRRNAADARTLGFEIAQEMFGKGFQLPDQPDSPDAELDHEPEPPMLGP